MGKIAKMTPHLANMIAAGEVVERPSSVVKELVENAIDANADTIYIYLTDGGLTQIKIVDNGEGMDKDDVTMAFLPHATSKIKNEYDLTRIMSLGFRGEAIASIASVSKMQIISSQDGICGYQTTYQAGVKQSEGIIDANKGTTVIVENLFFNTPARLKYLKPAKNELASITYLLDRIALTHPNIRFKLFNDSKVFLSTTGSNNNLNLFGEIYGLEVAKNLLSANFVIDGIEANLILVKPEVYRSNKLEMTLIVNGRYVKNYNIINAIIEGYQTYLPIGKYPICVIYLNIDPLLVDVNVHPSKMEIKISNEEIIISTIIETIKKTLGNASLIPSRFISKDEGYKKTTIFELPRVRLDEEKVTYVSEEIIVNNELNQEERPNIKKEGIKTNVANELTEEKKEEPIQRKLPYFEYIGQAFGTYLLFQNSLGLYIMDQHAAAERINYEKYYKLLGDSNQPTTDLLVPELLSLSKSEIIFLEENYDEFVNLGFIIEPISSNDYVIRQIPLWAKSDDVKGIVRDIFAILYENKKVDVIEFRDQIAKQISCKASIKANHYINKLEIDSLIENLNKCNNPFTCPHGRPTIIKLSNLDIEKMFERS